MILNNLTSHDVDRLYAITERSGGARDKTQRVVGVQKQLVKDTMQRLEVLNSCKISTIQSKVASYFNISENDLLGSRRMRSFSRPRQIAMYLCKLLPNCSYPEIGRSFGNRDHTTIMHGVKNIEILVKNDVDLQNDINSLKLTLQINGIIEEEDERDTVIEDISPPPISINSIITIIAGYYNIRKEDLLGRSKSRKFARPRQIIMYLADQLTRANYSGIAEKLDRNHTSVISGISRISALLLVEDDIGKDIDAIKTLLQEKHKTTS